MSVDVLIAAGIATTQLLTTIYGVVVSISEKHLRVAIILGIVGGTGVGLTVWGAVRNDKGQQNIQSGLNTANSGIQDIKERIKQPPAQLTPPPTSGGSHGDRASVVLMKMESAYQQTIDNVETGNGLNLVLGKPIAINLYFENKGPAEGDNAGGFGKVYLVKGSETPEGVAKAEKDAIRQFQHDLDERTIHGSPIEVGEQGAHWFTATSDRDISQDDIDSVTVKQSQIIYLLSRFQFEDKGGKHFANYCQWLQFPAFKPEVWHHCFDFHQHG